MTDKSSVEEIRARFDADVERFSNLETGQSATVDAALALDLIAEAAAGTSPHALDLLDIGCGAGNYSLKLLQRLPGLNVTLIDLSANMLSRARERISRASSGTIETYQTDVREFAWPVERYDIILAAAVLHHLRTDDEWRSVFAHCYHSLRPGGSMWIFDLVTQEIPAVQTQQWRRYGECLAAFKGVDYRDQVFAYIEREDTPRSATYQLRLLHDVGFTHVDIVHKNSVFAAIGAVKSAVK